MIHEKKHYKREKNLYTYACLQDAWKIEGDFYNTEMTTLFQVASVTHSLAFRMTNLSYAIGILSL